ncbi:protein O-mannosyl-transferase family [Candidatus Altiarchaeota archaeon]
MKAKTRDPFRLEAIVFVSTFSIYLLTLCPTIYGGDSGDFITSAYVLGVPHPTGYPLYVILSHLFTYLPLGTVAYRVNLFSAVCSSLACVFLARTVYDETRDEVSGILAGSSLGFTLSLWDSATVAEVYALNALFFCLTVFLSLRYVRSKNKKDFYLLCLATGLALTNHSSFILYTPAILSLIYHEKALIINKKSLLLLILPLLLYAYIPLRASSSDYVWHDPGTLNGLTDFLTAREHRLAHTTPSVSVALDRMMRSLQEIVSELGLMILFTAIGVYYLRYRHDILKFTVLVVSAELLYIGFLHNVSLELVSFGIPVTATLLLAAGYGMAHVKKKRRRQVYFVGIFFTILLLSGNFETADKSSNLIAKNYGMSILEHLPEDAIIFIEADNNIFILNYLQKVEGVRRDVRLIDRKAILEKRFYGRDYRSLPTAEYAQRRMEREYNATIHHDTYYPKRVQDIDKRVKLAQEGLLYKAVTLDKQDVGARWPHTIVEDHSKGLHIDDFTREMLAVYYLRKADHFRGEGDEVEAMIAYSNASHYAGKAMQLHYNIALSHLGYGRYDDALYELKIAAVLGEDARVLGNACYANIMINDYASAETYCRRALEMDPSDTIALANQEHIRSRFKTSRQASSG